MFEEDEEEERVFLNAFKAFSILLLFVAGMLAGAFTSLLFNRYTNFTEPPAVKAHNTAFHRISLTLIVCFVLFLVQAAALSLWSFMYGDRGNDSTSNAEDKDESSNGMIAVFFVTLFIFAATSAFLLVHSYITSVSLLHSSHSKMTGSMSKYFSILPTRAAVKCSTDTNGNVKMAQFSAEMEPQNFLYLQCPDGHNIHSLYEAIHTNNKNRPFVISRNRSDDKLAVYWLDRIDSRPLPVHRSTKYGKEFTRLATKDGLPVVYA